MTNYFNYSTRMNVYMHHAYVKGSLPRWSVIQCRVPPRGRIPAVPYVAEAAAQQPLAQKGEQDNSRLPAVVKPLLKYPVKQAS
jgi:hypothetical protein